MWFCSIKWVISWIRTYSKQAIGFFTNRKLIQIRFLSTLQVPHFVFIFLIRYSLAFTPIIPSKFLISFFISYMSNFFDQLLNIFSFVFWSKSLSTLKIRLSSRNWIEVGFFVSTINKLNTCPQRYSFFSTFKLCIKLFCISQDILFSFNYKI